MDFAFTSDQQLLKNSARAFLDEHCKASTVRALWADPRGESEAMWKEMAQLGWLGLSLPETFGGSDLGMVETALLLEEMGRASYPGPYLPTLLVATAINQAGTDAQKERWLPAVCAGGVHATAALLDGELSWAPEAIAAQAERSRDGWKLSGTKPFVPWAHIADVMLVPAQTPEGLTVFLVDPRAGNIVQTPVTGMDLSTRWVNLTFDGVDVAADDVLGWPGNGEASQQLEALLRIGAVGAAAEMLGAARRCLDMAVEYAKVREQFGQPIGSFQAIRHKCAEMLLEVENSHAAVYYAAWALDAKAEDADLAASVAKAYVGDASRKVCGEAIQVHGGIGFTWEYDLHLYFKRAKALEVQYGDADYHRELITRRVI